MPRPLAATLVAEAWVESLQRKLQIKLMKYKGTLREHLVVIYQGQREYSPILLSQTPGDRRVDLSAQLEQVPLHDLPDSFAAALLRRQLYCGSSIAVNIAAALLRLREQMDDARDAQAAKELLAQAKAFFTGIFGVGFRGGRLSDEDRNAVAAASAAILPRDLFAKRGRAAAASRLTGLGYRRLHRGSDARRELEDRACGWRRVRTAGHKDKVDYGPLNDFWHSDLASTEDNQNKHMVRDTFRSWQVTPAIVGK